MSEPAALPPPKKANYAWVYFFTFLIIASVGVTWITIAYSNAQQLTREKLDAAENLWNEKGPKSYKLVYTKEIHGEKLVTFSVTVHQRKVTDVLMDGKPLEKNPDQTDDPKIYHSMEAQFLAIQRFKDLDDKPGAPKVYCVAIFDMQTTGAVRKYVRRIMGTQQRVELIFEPVVALQE
jgi:hypothetical protein